MLYRLSSRVEYEIQEFSKKYSIPVDQLRNLFLSSLNDAIKDFLVSSLDGVEGDVFDKKYFKDKIDEIEDYIDRVKDNLEYIKEDCDKLRKFSFIG